MAVPPKFIGHRLVLANPASPSASSVDAPLHTLELYLDYVCPFSASSRHPSPSYHRYSPHRISLD